MSSGPPKRRSGARPARQSAADSPSKAGNSPAGVSAGALRRRQRRKPDHSRLWRVVMWVAIAFGLAWIPVAIVWFGGDDEETAPPRRLMEITASADGCTPRDFSVAPGEGLIFRVTNTTDSDFEVIVTDEAGVSLRTSPGYDPDDPVSAAAPGSSVSGAHGPRLLAAGILAHDGHETEEGPNATADFRYRMIVAENGVRIMVVTFPEIGEFDPLTRLLCTAIGPDGELDLSMPVGRIAEATAEG